MLFFEASDSDQDQIEINSFEEILKVCPTDSKMMTLQFSSNVKLMGIASYNNQAYVMVQNTL